MAVYRFRVLLEDQDDFYRDIDVLSNQTFEDFHKIILDSVNFENNQLASFFISDDFWRKGQEITLIDMSDDGDVAVMKDLKLAKFIDDPHQRFIYVYDYMSMWTFYAELIKIIPEAEKGKEYPCIYKAIGDNPLKAPGAIGAVGTTEGIFDEEFGEDTAGLDDEEGEGTEGESEDDEFGLSLAEGDMDEPRF